MTAHFEDICRQLCETLELPLPQRPPAEQGLAVLVLTVDGAEVLLAQRHDAPELLQVIGTLGLPAADSELEIMRMVLDANLLMIRRDAPVFSRDPETGEILLQQSLPLQQTDAESLCAKVRHLARMSHNWKSGEFFAHGLSGRLEDPRSLA